MRLLPVVIVAFLLLLAVSTFLVYGGRAAVHPATSVPTARPPGSGERYEPLPPPDLRPEIEGLSKRIDDLGSRIEMLERSSERKPNVPASTSIEAGEAMQALRNDVFRAVAEERDLRLLPARTETLRSIMFAAVDDKRLSEGDLGSAMKVLTETEKRYREIVRRVLPCDPVQRADDAQRQRYRQEITDLREWRRAGLAQVVGAGSAQDLIEHLKGIQPLSTELP